jgi:hypothetical protein
MVFKKDGLIELEGKKISIKAKKGLVRLSDFYAYTELQWFNLS